MLTGASGQLGRHVLEELRSSNVIAPEILATSLHGAMVDGCEVLPLDLCDSVARDRLLDKFRPTKIIHLASLSRPGTAEAASRQFNKLETGATLAFSEYVRQTNGWMFYASSDFVLLGECVGKQHEDAPVQTDSVYSRGKLNGELAVLDRRAGCVGRLSMMWGITPNDYTPWGRLVSRLQAGREVFGITDELRTPLPFFEAARIIVDLASVSHGGLRGFRGRINIGGDKIMTPFDLICQMRDQLSSDATVRPVTQVEYSPNVRRPKNMALDIGQLKHFLSIAHRYCWDA